MERKITQNRIKKVKYIIGIDEVRKHGMLSQEVACYFEV